MSEGYRVFTGGSVERRRDPCLETRRSALDPEGFGHRCHPIGVATNGERQLLTPVL